MLFWVPSGCSMFCSQLQAQCAHARPTGIRPLLVSLHGDAAGPFIPSSVWRGQQLLAIPQWGQGLPRVTGMDKEQRWAGAVTWVGSVRGQQDCLGQEWAWDFIWEDPCPLVSPQRRAPDPSQQPKDKQNYRSLSRELTPSALSSWAGDTGTAQPEQRVEVSEETPEGSGQQHGGVGWYSLQLVS